MKVIVVGSGGREHAVALKLKESALVDELICAPGNAGMAKLAKCVPVAATDIDGMVVLALSEKADFVVVTPDDPLAMGMVDALEKNGIAAFGPCAAAARIEASKVFSKEIMQKYDIPTAKCGIFDNAAEAKKFIAEIGMPAVIKADGLAKGKGVIIAESFDEAYAAIDGIIDDHLFGSAGNSILIEEFLRGVEVSVMCFVDGKTIVPMVSSQDHKRLLDGDKGKNTGGMGAFAPSPSYTKELAEQVQATILEPTVKALNDLGSPFKGVLYAGLMLTDKGPYVLEYNARFGDPETQVVLPLLKSDLMEVMLACRNSTLDKLNVEWSDKSAAIVIMVSGGYPDSYKTKLPISGIENIENCTVIHAGTAEADGQLLTAGGRVLGVSTTADTLSNALKDAYNEINKIQFDGAFYRNDIGKRYREVK